MALKRSIELRPTMAAYSNLGSAYFYTRRYTEAGDAYRKATELDSKDWLAWGNLGDALYWTSGRRPEASQAYQTARKLAAEKLSVNPNDGLTIAFVADYSAMLDDKAKAFADIDHALKLSPNDGDVLFRAAVVHNHFSDDSKTLALLQQAVQHGFSTATIRDTPDFDHLNSNQLFAAITAKK